MEYSVSQVGLLNVIDNIPPRLHGEEYLPTQRFGDPNLKRHQANLDPHPTSLLNEKCRAEIIAAVRVTETFVKVNPAYLSSSCNDSIVFTRLTDAHFLFYYQIENLYTSVCKIIITLTETNRQRKLVGDCFMAYIR